jgi:hypothetical protein
MRLPPTTARLVAESVKNSVQCWPHAGVRLATHPGPLSKNVAGDALQSIPSRRRLWATFVPTWRTHGPHELPSWPGASRQLRPKRVAAQTRCDANCAAPTRCSSDPLRPRSDANAPGPRRAARQGLRRAGGACAGRRGPARRPWRTCCHRPGQPRRGCPAWPRRVRGLPGRSFQGVLTRWGWWPSRPPGR